MQLVVRFRRLLVVHELPPLRVPAQVALDMVARVREHLDLVVPLVALAPLVVLVLLVLSVHSDPVVLVAALVTGHLAVDAALAVPVPPGSAGAFARPPPVFGSGSGSGSTTPSSG